jgi:glycolate oxidase
VGNAEGVSAPARNPEPIADLLARELGADRVVRDPDVRATYAHDEAAWAPFDIPSAVIRATSTADVQRTVEICRAHAVPIVARGAGTGLSGGANAVAGGVVVSFERMNRILEINPEDRYAVVQPGVVNDELRAALAPRGLWYPPDPASSPWSTIGGNVATNAGGMCCVKYGVTRDYVLEVEFVNARAQCVRVGRRTAKGVAGYDLLSLIVGSEGTLGLITEITVKLRPLRTAPEATVAGFFPDLPSAGRAVAEVTRAGLTPSALELIDRPVLEAVDKYKQIGLSAEADVVLLGRVDTAGEPGDDEIRALRDCFVRGGATWVGGSTDAAEAEAMFAARRLAYPALERLGDVLTEDVCVPRSRVAAMLDRIHQIGLRHDVQIANVAHAGDGNLHPLMLTEPGDDASRQRAQAAFHDIIDAALELGGTVTGEHGVGLLKKAGWAKEAGPEVLAMHRALREALDPDGLFNPGKVLD